MVTVQDRTTLAVGVQGFAAQKDSFIAIGKSLALATCWPPECHWRRMKFKLTKVSRGLGHPEVPGASKMGYAPPTSGTSTPARIFRSLQLPGLEGA
jgi:hypothetical protein